MNILILAHTSAQLDTWRDKNFTQGDIIRHTTGTLTRGDDTMYLVVARPHDDRVRGMEFQRVVYLPGAVDFGGQYSMRIRE